MIRRIVTHHALILRKDGSCVRYVGVFNTYAAAMTAAKKAMRNHSGKLSPAVFHPEGLGYIADNTRESGYIGAAAISLALNRASVDYA